MNDFRQRLSTPQQLMCDVIQASNCSRSRAAAASLRSTLGDPQAYEFAQEHEVAALVGHHYLDSTEPADRLWIAAHEEEHHKISGFMQELDEIAALFAGDNIELIALKNGGIARGLYSCVGCCPMGDLDLLVRPRHFRRAHELLLAHGYEFEFRLEGLEADLEKGILSGSTEYFRQLPGCNDKLWIDFQSRPVAGHWIRPDQEPSADELIDRAVQLPDSPVRILAPADNLLQVCLHTAKHSYVRAPGLRLHTDVDRVVISQQIDWQDFLSRVEQYSVRTPVYFSLRLAKELLGTPISDEILEKLRPRSWKVGWVGNWIERAGLFEPKRRKFSHLGYVTFTALQYDSISGLYRAIFPHSDWMKQQYGPQAGPLAILHLRRLRQLLFRRFST